MPLKVQLGISTAQIAYAEAILAEVRNGASTALRTATNEALTRFRTKLVNMLNEEHLAKKGEIRDRVRVSSKAVGTEYGGAVTVDYGQVPIIDFKTRFTKKAGAKVQMLASEPMQVFKHAFKSTMNSGHTGGFQRKFGAENVAPQSGSYKNRRIKRGLRKGQFLKRQPIKELFGTPVVRVFDIRPNLTDEAADQLGTIFSESLDRKIKWQLDKAAAK